MSKTHSGTLLIADITGYTHFLSESELEHAQEILESLLNLLIDQTRPPLIISRTAGDAVISYAIGQTTIQGQTFVELLEDTYVAFRRAIELLVLNNTCRCAACANVAALDLKFFVHYGTFGVQTLGGHDELVGSDVNLLHRLLKNHIIERTGIKAYTVYTAAAVEALGLAEIAQSMTTHAEEYEHLGDVGLFVEDMQPVWNARREQILVDIPQDQVLVRTSRDFPLPPHLLWDMLSRPEYRNLLLNSVRQSVLNRQEGRIAPGSEFHCDHGKNITRQRILTWKPFEMMLTEDTAPIPGTSIYIRWRLLPNQEGTTLEIATSHGRGGAIRRRVIDVVARRILPGEFERGMERLHNQLTASAATNLHQQRT